MRKVFFAIISLVLLLSPSFLDAQAKVYWVDYATNKVQRANLDGSSVEDIRTAEAVPVGIAIDSKNSQVYFGTSGKIRKSNMDGTGAVDLVTGLTSPCGVAVDTTNNKVYFTDNGTERIYRCNLDGTSLQTLISSGVTNPCGIALDVGGGKMYWADDQANKIQRANLDGTSVQDIITTGLTDPYGIAVDSANSRIYFSDYGSGKIQRANLDGSSVTDIVTGLGLDVDHLALDANNGIIYFSTYNTLIRKVSTAGTGLTTIVSSASTSTGVAVYAPNVAPTATNTTQTQTYAEGTASVSITDIVVTDPDTGDTITATLTLANYGTGSLSASSGNGETYNGGTGVWTVTGTLTAVNNALSAVAFVPNAENDLDTTASVRIRDAANTGPADGTITLDVNPVNDPPTATNTTQTKTYTEGAASVALDDIVVTDVDTGETITATLTLANTATGSLTASSGNGETYNGGTGVWTVTGTLTAVNNALAAVSFTPAANNESNTTVNARIRDFSNTGPADGTITLNVTLINDQPEATNLDQTKSYTEGDAGVALDDIVVTDPDTGETITATLTLANTATGTLSAASGNGETYNGGTGVWTVTGTLTVVNNALAAVAFIPAANNDVNTTVATSIADGGENGAVARTGTINLNVTGVNDQLEATNLNQTKTFGEGSAGVALDDIVVSDPDTGETVTATLTLANTATGSLTASSGNGETYNGGTGVWTVTGTLTAVNNALAAVAFNAAADNETSTTIAVSIADGGENGTVARTGTINLNVTPVNDQPEATNLNQTKTYTEDAASVALDDIVVSDADTGETVTATLTLANIASGALSAASGNGETYNAGTGVWTVTGTLTVVNNALAAVAFIPASNNDVNTTVATSIADGGENGTVARTGTIALNVTPVNDQLEATNLNQTKTFNEGSAGVALDNIVVSDADTGETATATLTLANTAAGSLTAASGNGETYNGGTGVWTVTGTLTAVNNALAAVSFNAAADNETNTTIAVSIADGGENGTVARTGTINLNVIPVNDQLEATNLNQTKTYTEGAASVALDDIVVSDPDTGETATATLTLANTATGSLTATSGNGETYNSGTGVWTVTGTLTVVNNALAAVAFSPATNNDANTTVAVSIADGGENGTVARTGTINLNATGVNDQLEATNLNQTKTFNEGASGVALDDIVVTDADTGETVTATLTLANTAAGSLTTSSGNGETYNSGTGVWTVTGTLTAVNNALAAVAFNAAADNETNTTIAVSIADGGENGTVARTGTINLNVTPVNDQPEATNLNQAQNYTEGDASVAIDNIVVTDPDTGETVTATLTLQDTNTGALTASSGNGETYNGTTGVWTVTGTLTAVNNALAAVAFNPATNNSLDTTVEVSIADGGENGTVARTGTINLNVTPVNDAPTATNTNQNINYIEDTARVEIGDIVVSDPDSGDVITVTLTLANTAAGRLTADSGGDESYNPATGVWQVSGLRGAVNAALADVAFIPAVNFDLNTSIAVHVRDQANSGPADGVIQLNNTPVNDQLQATNLTQNRPYTKGTASVALLDIVTGDVDTGEQATATLILANTATGVLSASSGNGETYNPASGVWTITGTLTAVNNALAAVAFNPDPNNEADTTIAVNIADGGENGTVALTGTITLDVTATPVVSTMPVTSVTETSAISGGKVTSDGGTPVVSRGVCWGTAPRPTIKDNRTEDGRGTGSFTSTLSGLTPNTHYYLRAYATNAQGTSYGGQEIFTTSNQENPPVVTITQPADGTNVSGTVSITAQALSIYGIDRVEFYVDGDKIGEGLPADSQQTALTFDVENAVALFIDPAQRLRKLDTQHTYAPVITPDTAVRFIERGPSGEIYIVFQSRQRLSDGKLSLLGRLNLSTGECISVDTNLSGLYLDCQASSPVQFDGQGHVYCLALSAEGEMAVKKYGGDPAYTFSLQEGDLVQSWLVKTDGSVLLYGYRETSGQKWVKHLDNRGHLLASAEMSGTINWMAQVSGGQVYTGLKSASPLASLKSAGEELPAGITLVESYGNRLLLGITQGSNPRLLVYDPATHTGRDLIAGDIRVLDLQVLPDRTIAFSGQEVGGKNSLIGTFKPSGSEFLFQELGTFTGRISGAVVLDKTPAGNGAKPMSSTNLYTLDWDSGAYAFGTHTLMALALDIRGQSGQDSVTVNIPEIILQFQAVRKMEKAWILARYYGDLSVTIQNSGQAQVARYVILRKSGPGAYSIIKAFQETDMQNGSFTYTDKYLEKDQTYTYRVEARDANDAVMAVSGEISI